MKPDEADARAEARRVLEEACVTRADQIDIEAIAERMNAEIVYTDLDGATASVMRIGDSARIRISNRVQDIGPQRFVGAHEIGHLRLNHEVPHGNMREVVERTCSPLEKSRKVTERMASVFASELVMPEHLVRRYCEVPQVTLGPAREIAGEFMTSLLASAMRFVELSPERCAVAYSVGGRVKWLKRSATFPSWVPSGRRVDPTSAVNDYFAHAKLDPAAHVVGAEAWLPRTKIDDSTAQIVEQSAVIPEAGAVFTMLWLPASERVRGDFARLDDRIWNPGPFLGGTLV